MREDANAASFRHPSTMPTSSYLAHRSTLAASLLFALLSGCAEAEDLEGGAGTSDTGVASDAQASDARSDVTTVDSGRVDTGIATTDTAVTDTMKSDAVAADTKVDAAADTATAADAATVDSQTADSQTTDSGPLADSVTDVGGDGGDPCATAIAALRYSFEAGTQGWTHAPIDGQSGTWPFDEWERGTSTTTPGPTTGCNGGASCFGIKLTDNYAQCTRAALRSPTMNLSSCAGRTVKLVYWHAYKFNELVYNAVSYKDGGVVEISKNATVASPTWAVAPITTSGTININPNMGSSYACLDANSFHVDGLAGYVGTNGGWQKAEFTVPADYLVSGFAVRFAYGAGVAYQTTNANTSRIYTEPGWYLDDVSVELP